MESTPSPAGGEPRPGATVIIDSHAHLVAPASLYVHRSNLTAARGQYGDPYRAVISDAELEKSAAQNIGVMDGVGTDVQVLSPRPFMLLHGVTRWEDIQSWTMDNNDVIARTIALYPTRFRGVAGLPQALDKPVSSVFDELQRCVDELGFVGVMLNPDPSEGQGTSPPLGDPYWYPLFERLCELDLPAHVHSCQCSGRETYDEHFISEESLAITSLIRADIFRRYPALKLMISHGGGAIPFQVGRWRSNRQMAIEAKRLPPETESFDATLRRFWFDTVVHNRKSLELLFDVVGTHRCLFGTERPGSGGGTDPNTGRPYDDLKPVIESIGELSTEDRLDIFEGNARRFFTRLKV